ncbi:pancreatic polypeptide prohormone isoform X1 [Ochotona princeps]|uniref:pancreatic polypeptide prohormone isoform X1 n=2 Tax=Ochotona princeps TaxID=9978 RepID=UPI0027152A9E|nr:pancreatic polypeptide prohormone isoform X1 [Ochotona princeps]
MDRGAGQAGPASLGKGLCSALPPWHLLPVPQMAAAARCLSLLLLCTCVALLLQPPQAAQGAPLEPVYPGDNATPEQMAQYAAELRRYINMLTRPRYGKRDRAGAVDVDWGSPHAAGPRELGPTDL